MESTTAVAPVLEPEPARKPAKSKKVQSKKVKLPARKTCPSCKHSKDVKEDFGFRKINGKKRIMQSYCKKCRGKPGKRHYALYAGRPSLWAMRAPKAAEQYVKAGHSTMALTVFQQLLAKMPKAKPEALTRTPRKKNERSG